MGTALPALVYPSLLRYLGYGLLGVVLLAVMTVFLTRAGGEIGLVPLSPALYFSVVAFAVSGADRTAALLMASTICCAALAAVYFTYSVKVAHDRPEGLAEPPGRLTGWTQLAGGLAGAVVGVLVIAVLSRAGVLGEAPFPLLWPPRSSSWTPPSGDRPNTPPPWPSRWPFRAPSAWALPSPRPCPR